MKKYPKSHMTTAVISEIRAKVYHGIAFAGKDFDHMEGAVFSQDADAGLALSSRAFQWDMDPEGAERCVLIREDKFAELLAIAGITESEA